MNVIAFDHKKLYHPPAAKVRIWGNMCFQMVTINNLRIILGNVYIIMLAFVTSGIVIPLSI